MKHYHHLFKRFHKSWDFSIKLNLECLDVSEGSSYFLWTVTNSRFSITHSGQSSSFILIPLVRGWMINHREPVVWDMTPSDSGIVYNDLQPLIVWRDMELTIFDKAFMVKEKMLQRNLAGEVSTQDANTFLFWSAATF